MILTVPAAISALLFILLIALLVSTPKEPSK